MKIFRVVAISLWFLFFSGCATTTSVVTRPPRFTGAFDSKGGLVLVHDGLPGDRLVIGAEGSAWEFQVAVPYSGDSWVSAGTAPRTKVIGNRFTFTQNSEWGVAHEIWSADQVTTGFPKMIVGTVTMDGKSRPLVVRILEPKKESAGTND